jgi:xyloglucan-specific endo-beta-1,4-glucanase
MISSIILTMNCRQLQRQELCVFALTATYYIHDGNHTADANLDLRVGLGKSLSSIASIPTVWQWTYSAASSGLVADVSYDLWLSNSASSSGASSSSTFEMYV